MTPVNAYSDARNSKFLSLKLKILVRDYKNTPGLLCICLGNENNYGLFWAGPKHEDFPDERGRKKCLLAKEGKTMYQA